MIKEVLLDESGDASQLAILSKKYMKGWTSHHIWWGSVCSVCVVSDSFKLVNTG